MNVTDWLFDCDSCAFCFDWALCVCGGGGPCFVMAVISWPPNCATGFHPTRRRNDMITVRFFLSFRALFFFFWRFIYNGFTGFLYVSARWTGVERIQEKRQPNGFEFCYFYGERKARRRIDPLVDFYELISRCGIHFHSVVDIPMFVLSNRLCYKLLSKDSGRCFSSRPPVDSICYSNVEQWPQFFFQVKRAHSLYFLNTPCVFQGGKKVYDVSICIRPYLIGWTLLSCFYSFLFSRFVSACAGRVPMRKQTVTGNTFQLMN